MRLNYIPIFGGGEISGALLLQRTSPPPPLRFAEVTGEISKVAVHDAYKWKMGLGAGKGTNGQLRETTDRHGVPEQRLCQRMKRPSETNGVSIPCVDCKSKEVFDCTALCFTP